MLNKQVLVLPAVLIFVVAASCASRVLQTSTPTPDLVEVTVTFTDQDLNATGTPSIEVPASTPTPDLVEITVYFTDRDLYVAGTPPFEVPVTRRGAPPSSLPEAVLMAFFEGPTAQELDQGLESITSGFDGFSSLTVKDGIARIHLTGECASLGAIYTVAQPIIRNLLQFPDVRYVKIYDENGETEDPEGESNSIPFCLEP